MKYNKLHVFLFMLTSIASSFGLVTFYAKHDVFDLFLGLLNGALAVYWFTRLKDK